MTPQERQLLLSLAAPKVHECRGAKSSGEKSADCECNEIGKLQNPAQIEQVIERDMVAVQKLRYLQLDGTASVEPNDEHPANNTSTKQPSNFKRKLPHVTCAKSTSQEWPKKPFQFKRDLSRCDLVRDITQPPIDTHATQCSTIIPPSAFTVSSGWMSTFTGSDIT